MICEIGAFLHKGEGTKIVAHFKEDPRVLGAYVEAGRTSDLFRFREFGSASENDIVMLIVNQIDTDSLFDEVCDLAGIDAPQRGLVFLMPLHTRIGV